MDAMVTGLPWHVVGGVDVERCDYCNNVATRICDLCYATICDAHIRHMPQIAMTGLTTTRSHNETTANDVLTDVVRSIDRVRGDDNEPLIDVYATVIDNVNGVATMDVTSSLDGARDGPFWTVTITVTPMGDDDDG